MSVLKSTSECGRFLQSHVVLPRVVLPDAHRLLNLHVGGPLPAPGRQAESWLPAGRKVGPQLAHVRRHGRLLVVELPREAVLPLGPELTYGRGQTEQGVQAAVQTVCSICRNSGEVTENERHLQVKHVEQLVSVRGAWPCLIRLAGRVDVK